MNYVCVLFVYFASSNFCSKKWVDLIDLSLRKDQSEALVGYLKKGLLVQRRVPLRVWLPVPPQFNQTSMIDFRLR